MIFFRPSSENKSFAKLVTKVTSVVRASLIAGMLFLTISINDCAKSFTIGVNIANAGCKAPYIAAPMSLNAFSLSAAAAAAEFERAFSSAAICSIFLL